MIRFLAGIALGILYYFRGFGITAWTHSLYDLIVQGVVRFQQYVTFFSALPNEKISNTKMILSGFRRSLI